MTEPSSFATLLERVKSGDSAAATELVDRYEPAIRRAIRVRLANPRLRRVVDSMDICQSVLGGFFVRAAMGEYDLENPDQLLKLLVVMARNKVADKARRERAARRDHRRLEGVPADEIALVGTTPTPSRILAGKELLAQVRDRLSDEERELADLRGEGLGWHEIAARLHGSSEALRKRLARGVARVERELGLDGS